MEALRTIIVDQDLVAYVLLGDDVEIISIDDAPVGALHTDYVAYVKRLVKEELWG